jgi:hypothetical protein
MSIKLRSQLLYRASLVGQQAPNAAAISASMVANLTFNAQLATSQLPQTSNSRLTYVPLPAPTSISAVALDDTSIRVSWLNNPVAGIVNYKVYKSTDGVTWTLAATVTGSPPAAQATLTALSPYTTYYTYVTQSIAGLESLPSAAVTTRTLAGWNAAVPLPTPLNVPKSGFYDFTPHLIGTPTIITDDAALPSGLVISGPPTDTSWRVKDSGSAVGGATTGGNVFRIGATAPVVTAIYVDAGNSTAGNGTIGNPYKTIQAAVNAAPVGATIQVAAGTYPELVTISTNGLSLTTAGGPLIYPVIIDGAKTRVNGILINGASGVTIDAGFKVQFTTNIGVYIRGPGINGCEIRGIWTYETGGSGIAGWGVPFGTDPVPSNWRGIQNVKVHDNRIERACNAFWGGTGGNEHITLANGIYGYDVYNNNVGGSLNSYGDYLAAGGGEGIDCKEGCENPVGALSAIGGLAGVHHNTVHDLQKNALYFDAGRSNTLTGGYTRPGFMRNLHVYDNLVYNVRAHGIVLDAEVRWADSATGTNGRKGGQINGAYFYLNTVYGCDGDGLLLYDYNLLSDPNFSLATVPLADDVTVINNICHGNNLSSNGAYSGMQHDHQWMTNVVYKDNVSTGNFSGLHISSGTPTVSGTVPLDPLFTNVGAADFSLRAGSPALNIGSTPNTPPTDLLGNPRTFGTKADAGAIERQS